MGNRAACPRPAADLRPPLEGGTGKFQSVTYRARRPRTFAPLAGGTPAFPGRETGRKRGPASVGESREAPAPYSFNRGSTLSAITWMASS